MAQILRLVAVGPFLVPGLVHRAVNQADLWRARAASAVNVGCPRTGVFGRMWSQKDDLPGPCTNLSEAPVLWLGPGLEAKQG